MASIDDLRAAFPHLGFGVYAYDPEGDVTLEVHLPDGRTPSITAATMADCVEHIFPGFSAEPTPTLEDPETPDEVEDPFG